MKVLMCNSFYYLRGGSERCFFDLSELLSDHGHTVIPFSMMSESNRVSEYSDFFVSHVDYPNLLQQGGGLKARLQVLGRVLYSREAKQKIEHLIEETEPDIAHVHGIAHEISPSILDAIKAAGIPIVQTLHDYNLICPNTNFVSNDQVCERCKKRRYYQVVLQRCKRDSFSASLLAGLEISLHKLLKIYEKNVDVFITPSRFLRLKLAEYSIDGSVIHVPNFVDLQRFQPGAEPANYFVYFGRLTRIKGVLTLMEAMRDVGSSHLYMVGQGELEESLRSYAQRHGIHNVEFLGHLSTEDLIPVIQRAAFAVVPSEWYENYPMTILESFACGTPVIGSRLGGIPELVDDGENGLLFESGNAQELADKIRSLLVDSTRAKAMGRNARQKVERVNNRLDHYRSTIAIYGRLLGNAAGGERPL